MRIETLEFLDIKNLKIEIFEENKEIGHIIDGIVIGEFGKFPIVKGVLSLLDNRWELYPEFNAKYENEINELNIQNVSFDINNRDSVESFGWQWQKWDKPYSEKLVDEVTLGYTNMDPSLCIDLPDIAKVYDTNKDEALNLENSVMIEGGCGHGQLSENWSKKSKYIIGLDLSDAVFSAIKKAFNRPNMDIIQCDLTNLKYFRKECIDFVYSFGVLHHTPSINKCFNELMRLAKPNAKVSIGVYYQGDSLKEKIALKLDMFVRFFISKLTIHQRYDYCEFMKKYIRKPIIGKIIQKFRLFHNPSGGDLEYVSMWNYDFFGGHYYQDYLTHEEYCSIWNNSSYNFRNVERKFGNFINGYKI